ncbi:serine protease 1-like [Cydia fagiglandana]|uniref:serine protease 1-like n=1 Tax=Cydia fagiglandana TaxID=1458189 RepID=UPI002FEE61B3
MYYLILLNSFIAISALESRVYNGVDLNPQQHRHLVLLEINNIVEDSICTGSIISEKWIITAAHCVEYKDKIVSITVRQFNKEIDRILTHVRPYNIFKHSLYIDGLEEVPNSKNDIALLKVSNRIVFDNYASPIKLAQVPPRIGKPVMMAGYGLNEISDMETPLPRQGVAKLTRCPDNIYEGMWCIYDHVKISHGDSGGPLTYKGKLVGITSASVGDGCTEGDSTCLQIYPKTTDHYNWILKVIYHN